MREQKEYTVYYILKMMHSGFLYHETVTAKNQKEAIRLVKEKVHNEKGKHAFRCSCKAPIFVDGQCLYNDMWYTRYRKYYHGDKTLDMLW